MSLILSELLAREEKYLGTEVYLSGYGKGLVESVCFSFSPEPDHAIIRLDDGKAVRTRIAEGTDSVYFIPIAYDPFARRPDGTGLKAPAAAARGYPWDERGWSPD